MDSHVNIECSPVSYFSKWSCNCGAMSQEFICATISKGWYKMASSQDKGRVEETECSGRIWYESNFREPTFLETPPVMRNYTKPLNPQELHWLWRAITSLQANVEYLYAKGAQNLHIPEWMRVGAFFSRQHHYSLTAPWFQSVLVMANIICRIIDLKVLGLGDSAEVVNEQYVTSLSVTEFSLIAIIVQA